MDRLKLMETFVQVVRTGSFVGAAGAIGVTRSVVTKHVAELEAALGVRLLHRTTRRVSPSDIGAHYFEFCSRVLQDIESEEAALSTLQQEPRGTLRIAVPNGFGSLYMAPALAEFGRRFPSITISATLSMDLFDRMNLIEQGFDVVVRFSQPREGAVHTRQICRFQRILCASPEFLAANGGVRHPDDLEGVDCLVDQRHTVDGTWRLARRKERVRVKVRGKLFSNSMMIIRNAARAGMGVAMLPTYCLTEDLKRGSLIQILPEFSSYHGGLYVSYSAERKMPQKVHSFLDFMEEYFVPAPWEEKIPRLADAAAE